MAHHMQSTYPIPNHTIPYHTLPYHTIPYHPPILQSSDPPNLVNLSALRCAHIFLALGMGKPVSRCILRPASSMMLIMIIMMIILKMVMMGFHWHKPGSMMIAICLGITQCQSCCAGCCLPTFKWVYVSFSSFIFFVRTLVSGVPFYRRP